jgi:cell division protein FtsB
MVDLRTHVASLIAAFLFLAVGIIIGVSLGTSERQTRVIRRLEQSIRGIQEEDRRTRQENAALRERMARLAEGSRELVEPLLVERLRSASVSLVICGEDSTEARRSIESAISTAGGRVASTIRLPADALAASSAGASPSLSPEVLETLGRALARGDGRARLAALGSAALGLDGDYDKPVTHAVLLCGWEDEARRAAREQGVAPEVNLARGLLAMRTRVVAAAVEGASDGGLRPLQRLGLPTVDNVDQPLGRLSLVLALAGRNGRFGIGEDAEQPVPDLHLSDDRAE